MKHAHLGDYLLWEGKPAKIVGEIDRKSVVIELLEDSKCPHCQGNLGKEQIHMIVSSPLFQNNSAMLPTIQDDDTLNIGKNQREKEDTPF